MKRQAKYLPELKQRAVRMVMEHGAAHTSPWAAMEALAPKLGCTAETLRRWVRQAERDSGQRAGLIMDERQRLTLLCHLRRGGLR